MQRTTTIGLLLLAFTLACFTQIGCGSGPQTASQKGKSATADPLTHTGSIDGYQYEVSGDARVKVEQIPSEAEEGDYPKVTCGDNWFAVQKGNLIVNDKDSGALKRGDTIKVDANGQVWVNGEKR